jgi:hypothetical protein
MIYATCGREAPPQRPPLVIPPPPLALPLSPNPPPGPPHDHQPPIPPIRQPESSISIATQDCGGMRDIDMIFSSIPMNNLRFETTFTTFDHLFVNATFGQVRPGVEPTMKDHILGSDEYLIRAQDTILQHLERFGNGPLQPIDDNQPDNDQENSYKHADENLAVHDIHNGEPPYTSSTRS